MGPDGHPELAAAPVTQLLPHLPLNPDPIPHLVPQSVNMWMGAAPNGERWMQFEPFRIPSMTGSGGVGCWLAWGCLV